MKDIFFLRALQWLNTDFDIIIRIHYHRQYSITCIIVCSPICQQIAIYRYNISFTIESIIHGYIGSFWLYANIIVYQVLEAGRILIFCEDFFSLFLTEYALAMFFRFWTYLMMLITETGGTYLMMLITETRRTYLMMLITETRRTYLMMLITETRRTYLMMFL